MGLMFVNIFREAYERLYRPGLVLLKQELEQWNEKADAPHAPYDSEVEQATDIITRLDEKAKGGVSILREMADERLTRLFRAAALLRLYEAESEITRSKASGYPARVLDAKGDDLRELRALAEPLKRIEPAEVLWDIIPKPVTDSEPLAQEPAEMEGPWDVFISHATEDKEPFVRELADALRASGLRVWYDRFTLKVGDHLRRSIDTGLARSRYGIVVLSPYFFAKEWPQVELDGLLGREIASRKVILPIWHHIDIDQVRRFSPILADRVAAKSGDGLDSVVRDLLSAMAA